MNKKIIVTVPGKVSLQVPSSIKLFQYFSLGEIMTGLLFKPMKEQFTAEFNIVTDPKSYSTGLSKQFSTFYLIGSDQIYYERRYGGVTCKILVDQVKGDRLKLYVNKSYLKFIKFKIDNIYPVGVHLTDLLLLKIIASGDLIVHAASLYNPKNRQAFLMVAPPDTGKTYTTFQLLAKGYKFLGEDLSYYDSKADELRCMPYTSTWGHRFSFHKLDISKLPFVGLFANTSKKGVEDLFGSDSVCKSAKLSQIYLLEKSSGEEDVVEVQVTDELMRKVMSIQRNEFSYYKNPLLRAFEYYHPLNIDTVFESEAVNMRKLFQGKTIFLVRAPNYEKFQNLIFSHNQKLG